MHHSGRRHPVDVLTYRAFVVGGEDRRRIFASAT